MSFNTDKCFILHISKKRKPTEYHYLLHNQVLEVTKDSKYLGVTISNDLSWANHISNITAKANRTIGFLMRNIHACPKEVKEAAYTTLVRPSIEYASAVWEPFNKNQIFQLDSVQRRDARFASNNFQDREQGAVTSIISNLKWESLEQRRAKARSVLMYKIVHNLVEIHAEHLLIPADSRTRGIAAFRTIYTRADVYHFSFFPRTIITCNSIPPDTSDQYYRPVPGRARVY